MKQSTNPVDSIVTLVTQTQYEQLPAQAVHAAKVFILDTIGVAISGSRVPFVKKLRQLTQQQWGGNFQARIWGTGEYVPAVSAALVNAYQIHNQEFDCLHEKAVVHPMATVLSTIIAHIEHLHSSGKMITGKTLITAVCIAVEVSSILGAAAVSPLRFFRPGVCGGLGAAMGLAYIDKLSPSQIRDLLGVTYSQSCGTMQAHKEGSATLPMQIAFNARNVMTALEMIQLGLEGPHDVINGPFGFYTLFEQQSDLNRWLPLMGKTWQISQLSHKPFPTGRAAHGVIDGISCLQKKFKFKANEISHIYAEVPELILRLVNRPASTTMHANYAKLCMSYITATYLRSGNIIVEDFDSSNIANEETQLLTKKLTMTRNNSTDPNALVPQTIKIKLYNGNQFQQDLTDVLGSPKRRLTEEQHINKFRSCCHSGFNTLKNNKIEKLIAMGNNLENITGSHKIIDLMMFN